MYMYILGYISMLDINTGYTYSCKSITFDTDGTPFHYEVFLALYNALYELQ